jgi:alcohol dehydrogenase (cytochrome c)
MRSIGLYGDKVFVNTPDAHVVGLNARSGAVVWDHTVADHKIGYEYTSGPIIAEGHVVAGMTGCTRYKNDVCFISAYDPDTGRELWRTSTIARPGEPGGDTWGDLPLTFRAGSDAWIPQRSQCQSDLLVDGAGQAVGGAVRGTDGDALYTNSTLALDPDTGKINWYHQFLPGETQDMDEVFENILVTKDGVSPFKMGKLGILWELDRKTALCRLARPRLSEHPECGPADRQGHLSARHDSRDRQGADLLSKHGGIQGLAGDGLSPADTGLLHSHGPDLRARHLRRGAARGRQWRRWAG